jgi:hypothetical protein
MVIFSGVESFAWLSPAPNPVTSSKPPHTRVVHRRDQRLRDRGEQRRGPQRAKVARHAEGQNDRVRPFDPARQKLGVRGVAGNRLKPSEAMSILSALRATAQTSCPRSKA